MASTDQTVDEVPSVWRDAKTPHGAALLAYRVDPARRWRQWAAWVQDHASASLHRSIVSNK